MPPEKPPPLVDVDEIAHRFRDLPAVRVTQQPHDVTTPRQLTEIADQLAPLTGGPSG
jgi:hypothetical protein